MLKHFNHWQLTDHHTISFPSSSLSSYANQSASKQFHSTHSFPPHFQFPIEHLSSSSSIPPPPPHHKPHSIRQVYSSSKIQLPRAGERENAITDRQRERDTAALTGNGIAMYSLSCHHCCCRPIISERAKALAH